MNSSGWEISDIVPGICLGFFSSNFYSFYCHRCYFGLFTFYISSFPLSAPIYSYKLVADIQLVGEYLFVGIGSCLIFHDFISPISHLVLGKSYTEQIFLQMISAIWLYLSVFVVPTYILHLCVVHFIYIYICAYIIYIFCIFYIVKFFYCSKNDQLFGVFQSIIFLSFFSSLYAPILPRLVREKYKRVLQKRVDRFRYKSKTIRRSYWYLEVHVKDKLF